MFHNLSRLLAVVLAVFLMLLSWVSSPLSADPGEGLKRAIEVQKKHTAALMKRAGVVGTGASVSEEGAPVVKVYIEKAKDAAGLPRKLDDVVVTPEVTGKIVAFGDTTARYRPAPIGVSTGHPNITAGTIGARVTDGTNVYALSNNHVFADEGRAKVGDSALQPGTYDGGQDPADAIGTLHDFEPIKFDGTANAMDAAIVKTTTDLVDNGTLPDGYGVPSAETAAATPRLKVKKYGRTTSLTSGRIDAVNVTVNVGYDSGVALFVGQVTIRPGTFSAGGDSGSLIVTQNGNHPVALLFAGSALVTIATPIDPILERFKVRIDDGAAPVATGSIAGTVISGSDGVTPIAGAAVSTETGQQAITDENGSYTLEDVPAGDRTVSASAICYAAVQQQVTVLEGQESTADFVLDPEATTGGTGTIKGQVKDTGGAKLGGVQVATGTGQSATTNPAGKYSIAGVPEGTVKVTASRDGYAEAEQQVELAAGATVTVNFALSPQ